MSYDPNWVNSNAQGRLTPAVHNVKLSDPQELIDAINRRRLLTYQAQQDFSSEMFSGASVERSPISTDSYPPFDCFRTNLTSKILSAPTGSLGGVPASPSALDWLWAVSDSDENKIIVSGTVQNPSEEVSLFKKLNGTRNWTD